MKKFLLVVILIIGLSISACSRNNEKASPTPAFLTREVTKSTGLYDAPNIDANMISELLEGQLLKPANGQRFFDCETIVDFGENIILCKVETIPGGKEGWVLQKWTKTPGD